MCGLSELFDPFRAIRPGCPSMFFFLFTQGNSSKGQVAGSRTSAVPDEPVRGHSDADYLRPNHRQHVHIVELQMRRTRQLSTVRSGAVSHVLPSVECRLQGGGHHIRSDAVAAEHHTQFVRRSGEAGQRCGAAIVCRMRATYQISQIVSTSFYRQT